MSCWKLQTYLTHKRVLQSDDACHRKQHHGTWWEEQYSVPTTAWISKSEFIDDQSSTLQDGQQTDILIMDFVKALDRVSHSLLIRKLHHYGIRGKMNNCIEHWLSGRTQTVVVEGEMSEPVSVDSGGPRGSVLGPWLFLYIINDLPTNLRSIVRLFADDTMAYFVIVLPKDADILQEEQDGSLGMRCLYRFKVDEKAMISNRYNGIPHPALDTKWDRNTYNLDGTK